MPKKVKFRSVIVIAALLSLSAGAMAQAGRAAFSFLELPYSARHNALGGENVSTADGDIAMALNNPALLCGETHNMLELNYAYYGAAMNFASTVFGYNWGHNYTGYAIHYLDYGKFYYSDEYGDLSGTTFSARDFLIEAMYARQLSHNLRVGVALKTVCSQYEAYNAFALGADVGAYYCIPDSSFQLGLTLQNIGWQLKGFYEEAGSDKLSMLPLNLQLGMSYKLPHAPLRFSMTVHNMQTWKLGYTDTDATADVKWYDMAFRHTVWALDIVPKKDLFWMTLSYNHRRRMEMAIKDQRSLAGFALGAGLHIKSVRFGVAVAQYTRSNYTFQTSLSLNINDLLK